MKQSSMRLVPRSVFTVILTALLCACASTKQPTTEHFDALGVKNGLNIYDAQAGLAQDGYHCEVSGEKHENYNCSKIDSANFSLSSCMTRVMFRASESNLIENLTVPPIACSSF